MPIRVRTIFVILLTNLVIILFSVSAGVNYVRSNIEKSQETDLMMVANIADHFISSEIELLKLKTAGAAERLTGYDDAKLPEILASHESLYPDFIGMAVLDAGKGIIASAGELPALPEIMEDEYVKQAFSGESALSSTIPSPLGVVFYSAVPMEDADNRILVVTIPGMYFAQKLSTFVIWDTGHIFIDDIEGTIIANIREQWVQNRVNFIRMAETDEQHEAMASVIRRGILGETGIGHFSVSGVPRICAYRPIRGSNEGWFLGVIAPLPESPFRDIHIGLIVVGVVGFILSVVAAIIASSFIKKPFEEVAALKEEAEANSRSKSDFLANMSHEIRTPMNAILGITEIQLHNKTLAPKMNEAFSKIYNSGELLLGIINDILDMSKIEAGKLELVSAKYDAASLINDTATLNVLRTGSKQIEFMLYVDENIPSALIGDELRIKQVLNNLLSNAFKYTEEGTVELDIAVEKIDDSDVTLIFKVSDTGQGMTEEQVSKLFDKYSRFNAEANRTTEGTGLGMSITQSLLRLMNGTISVESKLHESTVFTVRLPQKRDGAEVLGKELSKNLQNFRTDSARLLKRAQIIFEPMPYGSVLVVDDVESNLYVAKGLMMPYKLSVETVMSGFEAISKIKNGNVYDIVFMDHMMPKMDGMEATKIIRGLGYDLPIIALTANALIGQSEIFRANGFDDFISKPIDVRQLNAALKKYVRDKQPPEVIEAAQQKNGQEEYAAEETARVPPQLAEIFVRDALKTIAALEEILEKQGVYEDEDIRMYTINVHAIKSALANISEFELSDFAAELEWGGHKKDTSVIAQTPEFLDKLRAVVEKLTPPKEEEDESGEITDADRAYLREKLLAIKEACETYDKKTAKDAITELRQKTWPRQTKELLAAMSEHLLDGDFDEVSRAAEKIIGTTI